MPEGTDPRTARRQARLDQVLGAAWDLAHESGLAAVTLHEVARRVGLRQPSLYAYVPSKAGLFDAMFAQAATRLERDVLLAPRPADPRVALYALTERIVRFAAADPARQQLLFQRTVPGFAPSPDSYAIAVRFLDGVTLLLADAGLTRREDVDLYTALVAGLTSQQIANDPYGERWIVRIPEVLDMLLSHVSRAR